MIEKWKLLGSEYIVKRPWLVARRDTVQLPNGKIYPEYYVLEYPTWVNIIAITTDGLYVMVEQYRHGLQDVFTELCAGCVEEGEEPLEAAKRELLEETGYTGGQWELSTVICGNPATSGNLTYCFTARGVKLTDTQHLDSTEDIAVKLFTEQQLYDFLANDNMKQALMAAPLWKHFATKGK